MKNFPLKESCKFIAMIIFFSAAAILSQALIPVRKSWDFILVETLTLVSCLGLFAVVVAWVIRIRDRKSRRVAYIPRD
jgi:uncharacterized membrane protein